MWQNELNKKEAFGECDYWGERADELEALPPTPREEEVVATIVDTSAEPQQSSIEDEYLDLQEQDRSEAQLGEWIDLLTVGTGAKDAIRKGSKDSVSNSRHLYGGTFSKNDGRRAMGAARSKKYWMGAPGRTDDHSNYI